MNTDDAAPEADTELRDLSTTVDECLGAAALEAARERAWLSAGTPDGPEWLQVLQRAIVRELR